MRKTTYLAVFAALVLTLSAAVVCAQGRSAGYGRMGLPCPYGYTQPNPDAGGWWTRVQPATPEQKAFVDKVSDIHRQIREKQLEIAKLRTSGGDEKKIASVQKDIDNLRKRLHDLMYQNRELRRQMKPTGPKFSGRYGAWRRPMGWHIGPGACCPLGPCCPIGPCCPRR